MNREPENSPQSAGDDQLDQLLNEARWPQATPIQVARSAQHWRTAWEAQGRREQLASRAAVVAIAATFLFAVTLGWTWLHRSARRFEQPVIVKHPDSPPNHDKATPVAKTRQAPRIALRPIAPSSHSPTFARSDPDTGLPTIRSQPSVPSRPPTRLEEMLMAGLARGRRHQSGHRKTASLHPSAVASAHPLPAGPRGPGSKTPVADKKIDAAEAAVARLVADPKADPVRLAADLQPAPSKNEARLIAILRDPRPAEQIAATRLLGEMGSPLAVAELLRAAVDPNLHSTAINALSRIADSVTLNLLLREEGNNDLQRTLLTALLGRGDGESFGLYLSYVMYEATAETALAAAERTPNPPMEMLFSALRATSELERLAAARVLGRIDGPATTERLIALLEEGSSRQEACVALLSSRGPEAVNFVKSARANPTLSPLFQAAGVLLSNTSNNSLPRS